MTIVFPFQGSRGGLFHSSAALLAAGCIWAAIGLDRCIQWIASKRKWNIQEALPILYSGIALIAAISTISIFYERVGGYGVAGMGGEKPSVYRQVAAALPREDGVNPVVMMGDPPCYFAETSRSAIVIPEGGMTALLSTADLFHVRFVLLDPDIPSELLPLYEGAQTHERIVLMGQFSDGVTSTPYRLFRVTPLETSHAK
jgi:hypothetical protein